ncbi:MAG: hypothetical protein K2M96_10630 [Prevotella sp.]|nr:hypothetical protein [Prevotella sp.]
MLWFNKKRENQISNEDNVIPVQDEEVVSINKDKFILETPPSQAKSELPIYEIYRRFQEDWETKGYNDALNFPETTYRDNQKQVIIDQLRLAIKEILLHYEDKLVDLDIHISQAQKSGLMDTCDRYIQERKKLVAHHEELAELDKDAEEIGEKTKPILTSYEMGFTRGVVSLSNEKVSEIMNK